MPSKSVKAAGEGEEEEEVAVDDAEFEAYHKAQLHKAWRLTQQGMVEAAMAVMAALPEHTIETDDELDEGAAAAAASDDDEEADEVSEEEAAGKEGSSSGEAESDDDADDSDEAAEPPPRNVVRAQQALFSAVGGALEGEVERGASVDDAIERFALFAKAALAAEPLNLSKPRGLNAPLRLKPPPWRESSGQMKPFPYATAAEASAHDAASSFFDGRSADTVGLEAAGQAEAAPETIALPEAETDDEGNIADEEEEEDDDDDNDS